MIKLSMIEREFWLEILKRDPSIIDGYYTYFHKGKAYTEHRIIMELMLGRKISIYEIVHHIDGNKLNNNFKNLILMNNEDHTSLHHAGKRKSTNQNPPHKLSEEKIKKIKELSKSITKKNGKPNYSKIAQEVGVSDFTVARHLK